MSVLCRVARSRSLRLSAQWAPRDSLSGAIRTRRNLVSPSAREVPRREARSLGRAVARDREAAREAPPERGEEFWRVRGGGWLSAAPTADSTRAMRRSIFERELPPVWRNRLLTEITPDDLRTHCGKIVARGAPATAIHVRDILKQIYGFAILHGEKVANPADEVGPASIATFTPKERLLSPSEIRVMLKQLEHIATLLTIRWECGSTS